MKTRITTYTFDASAKTITFSGALDIEGFTVIENVVDNIMIYNFNDPLKGGTFATNTLTLIYDTSSMSETDELMILYEDGVNTVDTGLSQPLTDTQLRATAVPVTESNPIDISSLATSAKQLPDGHEVEVNNFPTEYPLPAAQVSTLTPPAAITGFATSAKQLPDNHQVTVSNIANTPVITGFATETTLGSVKTAVEKIDDAITGSEMQVDVITMPTTTVQATNLDIRDLVQTSDAVAVYGSDDGGTTKRIIKTDSGGAIQVDLEVANVTVNNSTGASAVNIQDGGNSITVDGGVTANAGTNLNTSALAVESGGNLASIKTNTDKIPSQGQALAEASLPVVLTAAQVTTLTPPAAITGFATSAKQLADNHQVTVSNIANTPLITGFATAAKQLPDGHTVALSATDNAVLDDIAANQTDGTQKTQIIDSGGEAVTVTGGKLDVNASIDTTGLATSTKQDTLIGHVDGIEGYVDGIEGLLTTIDADTGTIAGKDFATQTTLAAMNAKMVTGTDIGDVTINNSTGANAVNIQDGGNTITVDGTVTANTGLSQPLTDTQLRATAVPISVATIPSHAVTNAGTFAVQAATAGDIAAGATDSGNPVKVGGKYTATKPTLTDGQRGDLQLTTRGMAGVSLYDADTSTKITAEVDNADDVAVSATANNLSVVNRNTVFDGTAWDRMPGNSTDGTLVNLGTNNDVVLTAETTKVIGTVNIAAAQTVGITANSSVNIAQMNGVATTMGNGASGTGVQRVTIANDSTGQVKLAAGTAGIGKLTANSGVDIGDVDILSIAAGDNNIGNVDIASIAAGTNIIGKVGHNITGIGHGVKTVTTAGTDVALAASTACKKIDIQSQTDNTSLIAVGGSGVDATIATGTGVVLNPGDTYSLEIDNLADVYIDSLVNGEGARFTYYT